MLPLNVKQITLALMMAIMLASCSTTTKIQGRNRLYSYKRSSAGASGYMYSIDKPIEVKKIEEEQNKLKVTFKDAPKLTTGDSITLDNEGITARGISDAKSEKVFYFLDEEEDTRETFGTEKRKLRDHFAYTTLTYGIQSLSVPIKFRKAQSDKTSLPAGVETSFNLGLAIGAKKTLNVYKNKANFLNKKLSQYSLTPGIGFGFGSADLDPTSNAPGLTSKRKLALFSYGGFLMLGFNNINFGYAVGFDKTLGAGSSTWTYNNKIWHGLIVSLDIIKF